MLAEARRQRREEDKDYEKQCEYAKLHEPELMDVTIHKIPQVDAWYQYECKTANTDQQEFLKIIAKRVKEEIRDLATGNVGHSEPLQLLCMGRPGVGKSYVAKSMRRLFNRIGYKEGDLSCVIF